MTDPRPRPRAFRLDDDRVAVDDQPAPFAPAAYVRSEHQTFDPPTVNDGLDATEREIEAAQAQGFLARWRPSAVSVALTGLGGLDLARLRALDDLADRGPVRRRVYARLDRRGVSRAVRAGASSASAPGRRRR